MQNKSRNKQIGIKIGNKYSSIITSVKTFKSLPLKDEMRKLSKNFCGYRESYEWKYHYLLIDVGRRLCIGCLRCGLGFNVGMVGFH